MGSQSTLERSARSPLPISARIAFRCALGILCLCHMPTLAHSLQGVLWPKMDNDGHFAPLPQIVRLFGKAEAKSGGRAGREVISVRPPFARLPTGAEETACPHTCRRSVLFSRDHSPNTRLEIPMGLVAKKPSLRDQRSPNTAALAARTTRLPADTQTARDHRFSGKPRGS
jgi:hypothetical protein